MGDGESSNGIKVLRNCNEEHRIDIWADGNF